MEERLPIVPVTGLQRVALARRGGHSLIRAAGHGPARSFVISQSGRVIPARSSPSPLLAPSDFTTFYGSPPSAQRTQSGVALGFTDGRMPGGLVQYRSPESSRRH